MAHIVLGIGTSHTPMLNLTARQWQHRAEVDHANTRLSLTDGRRVSYAQLRAERGDRHRDEIALEVMAGKAQACQDALDDLASALERAEPDVVVIVGDDQGELFSAENQPAFAVYHGDEIATTVGKYHEGAPDWMLQIGRGYLMDGVHRLPGASDFAVDLIQRLMDEGADVAAVGHVRDPSRAGFGHAYGFIIKRLFRRSVPVVPVLLNTYFPPNVPSAGRCLDLGRKLRRAIEARPGDERVAVIASGGLSHFVVDEDFDRRVLHALRTRDESALRAIPREALQSGSSETLNWILVAGAVDFLPLRMARYQALYRTEAGTGVGAAFCAWAHDDLLS